MDKKPSAETTRSVMFHKPGPNWNFALPPIEQDGVDAHMEYMGELAKQGVIAASGPFMDGRDGGMILFRADIDHSKATALGKADPAFQEGLITFDVASWWISTGGF